MKRLLICILFMASMTACSPAAFGKPNCSSGGELCITLRAEEPILYGKPVNVSITVISEKDLSELTVQLVAMPQSIVVLEPKSEELGKVIKREQNWVNWIVDTKSDQPVIITRQIELSEIEGVLSVDAQAFSKNMLAQETISIYMTHEGGKVYYSGTSIPYTPGPMPTMNESQLATARAWPTDTPYPTLTTAEPKVPPTPTMLIVITTQAPYPEILGTAEPPPTQKAYP